MRKMKDSGVPWIGEIPEEWNLLPTKRLFKSEKRVAGSCADQYERLALTMQGVIKRSKDDNEGLQPEKFEGYQILKQNELVFKLIDLENLKTSRVGLSPFTGLAVRKTRERVLNAVGSAALKKHEKDRLLAVVQCCVFLYTEG